MVGQPRLALGLHLVGTLTSNVKGLVELDPFSLAEQDLFYMMLRCPDNPAEQYLVGLAGGPAVGEPFVIVCNPAGPPQQAPTFPDWQ